MKNRPQFKCLSLFFFIIISNILLTLPGYALEILLEPASVQRAVGGKARVHIYATPAENLISMGVKVSFNPSVVQVESAAKYEDFDNGWLMDADGNPATTEDQHTKPYVEVDNSTGSISMMGGRLVGNTTTGLSGKVLLGYVDFVAVANGSSDLVVDRFAYHPEHPTKTFDNFVKLNGSVDEPANLPGRLGSIYVGDDACECNLNHDGKCNILDYQLFIQDWGRQDCNEPDVSCECDLNLDGKCNILDYQVFIQDWGRQNCHL
jgi:hypothetical protein